LLARLRFAAKRRSTALSDAPNGDSFDPPRAVVVGLFYATTKLERFAGVDLKRRDEVGWPNIARPENDQQLKREGLDL
jgi:hypothetical protein